jgi:cysteine-rich repeat protein
MKHTEPRSVNPSVFLLFLAALALSSCGKEENNTPTPTEDMSAMVDMGEGEDMPRTCEGAGCEEMDIPSTCGDGNLDEGEACDDGNKDDGDYCAADCSRETGACGDGTKQDNEACDDGMNPDGACPYGETSCMVCDASCQLTDGATSFCGDGVVQQDEGELCDDGDDNADDAECLPDCTRPLPVAVGAGGSSSFVLMSNGTIYSWGRNEFGQLGIGTFESTSSPTKVVGLTNATRLLPSSDTSCAFTEDGSVFCWGYGFFGALGNGTFEDSPNPTQVVGLANIKDVVVGIGFGCALLENGDVHCWGGNGSEQLGFEGEKQNTPVKVELPGATKSLELGSFFACAILETDEVWCWGPGLGYGGPSEGVFTPREAEKLAGATELFGGREKLFFLRDEQLWGIGGNGGNQRELGVCCEGVYSDPVQVPDVTDVVSLDSEFRHSCALTAKPSIYCWGYFNKGQLSEHAENPNFVEVMSVTEPLGVDVGREHTCAIDGQNRVFCWGDNEFGQLGFDGEGGPTPREVTFWP